MADDDEDDGKRTKRGFVVVKKKFALLECREKEGNGESVIGSMMKMDASRLD